MSDSDRSALVARLDRSRSALLEALTERTEADFARALGGPFGDDTLGRALAALAQAERADLAQARAEVVSQRELPEKPLPPQVTHDLAGARHQTLAGLETLDDSAGDALVAAIVERESALVAQVGTMLSTPAAHPEDGAEPTDRTTKPRLQFPVLD
jgi:hypothetical protein